MANECESVSIKYQGNGTQQLFTFPFTYMSYQDVVAFIYDEEEEAWVNQVNKFIFANATTIEFLTPPPVPVDPELDNVWITRRTDLEQMLVTFYPGSSIRAKDLNDDFDQLRLAIQEGRCSIQDALNETVQMSDAFTQADQEAGAWVAADDKKVATSDAIIARHDAYIRDSKPPAPTYQQPGKNWQNTEECYTTYWNSQANAWVAYVNTGPRGIPGQDGTDGADGLQGPPGPTGPKGENGTGINVTGYIDQPGPPDFDGTNQGDFVIDSEGHGWFWETDVDPAVWVDTGTIRGPEGPPGPDGSAGSDGAAATIAVGVTNTGAPGTEASVVNSGTTSAAIFNFTIPRGEKGEPGQDGLGTLRSVRGDLPITIDSSVDATSPVIGIDISLLPSLPETP